MELPDGKPSSKRLLFDRRYGWVFDEWKDPSEEALAGGRGMFCIVPLAKALVKTASNSINLAASSVVKVIEKPDLLSHNGCNITSEMSQREMQVLSENHNNRNGN